MEDIRSILTRYPLRELDIRRLCANDPEFRFICRDYEQAAAAHRYWRERESERSPMTEDYAKFLGELEAEILSRLDSVAATTRNGGHSPAQNRGAG